VAKTFTFLQTDWIAGLRNQERKAQQLVFEKLNRKMFALCHRYITDPYEAEDVMMAGFMVVFSKIHQFSGEGSFEGWVRRVMVNGALQFLRKSKSMEINRLQEIEETPELSKTEMGHNLDYEVLTDIIHQLPLGYRMVFNLYAIEGYNHQEISEMLHISEGTSKSQLFKARSILQAKVKSLITRENQQNG
jgi:RNA polymerase sigma-70 factor (ECF subfamily)